MCAYKHSPTDCSMQYKQCTYVQYCIEYGPRWQLIYSQLHPYNCAYILCGTKRDLLCNHLSPLSLFFFFFFLCFFVPLPIANQFRSYTVVCLFFSPLALWLPRCNVFIFYMYINNNPQMCNACAFRIAETKSTHTYMDANASYMPYIYV